MMPHLESFFFREKSHSVSSLNSAGLKSDSFDFFSSQACKLAWSLSLFFRRENNHSASSLNSPALRSDSCAFSASQTFKSAWLPSLVVSSFEESFLEDRFMSQSRRSFASEAVKSESRAFWLNHRLSSIHSNGFNISTSGPEVEPSGLGYLSAISLALIVKRVETGSLAKPPQQMNDQVTVQGKDSLITFPWQESPSASEAGAKLFHDYRESVVKIQNGLGSGTGWIGPDGRVVTAYHVIKGATELFAVTADGHRHRLGGRVSIDDVADIAMLEIVGSSTDARRLTVAAKPAQPNESVRTLGHPAGLSLHLSEGNFAQNSSMEEVLQAAGKAVPRQVFFDSREKASYDQFITMKWHLSRLPCRPGNSGGPIFNSRDEVFSLCSMGRDGVVLSPEHGRLVAVLGRTPADEPFINNGQYVNGFTRMMLKAERQPLQLAAEGAFASFAALGLREFRPRSSNLQRGLGTALVLPYVAGQGYFDVSGYLGSTSSADSTYYGLASLADAGMLTGLAGTALSRLPHVQRAFKITALAGAGARAACEFMPNHYVLNLERADKRDPRPPFLDHVLNKSRFTDDEPVFDNSKRVSENCSPLEALRQINERVAGAHR